MRCLAFKISTLIQVAIIDNFDNFCIVHLYLLYTFAAYLC